MVWGFLLVFFHLYFVCFGFLLLGVFFEEIPIFNSGFEGAVSTEMIPQNAGQNITTNA